MGRNHAVWRKTNERIVMPRKAHEQGDKPFLLCTSTLRRMLADDAGSRDGDTPLEGDACRLRRLCEEYIGDALSQDQRLHITSNFSPILTYLRQPCYHFISIQSNKATNHQQITSIWVSCTSLRRRSCTRTPSMTTTTDTPTSTAISRVVSVVECTTAPA